MPLQATSGAASYDSFGGGVAAVPQYIEDVFSTWLYTGNGSTQTINNGIDLAGKGGLVWLKSRSAATNNFLFDTARGALNEINSNTTDAQTSLANSLTAYNGGGFSLDSAAGINVNAATYASWTFRKQPKFFDVVTYTGNGVANRQIAHNIGGTVGCILIKRTDSTGNWLVWHRSVNPGYGILDLTLPFESGANGFFDAVTDTYFQTSWLNTNGATYVAYLFAHNAGGFGLTGTDNVISCGSFTTNGSGNATVNLGYEPQWIMTKCASDPGFGTNWSMLDTMRGWTANGPSAGNVQANLIPNLSNAESSNNQFQPNATGFTVTGSFASSTIIYIAIRRGPMKVPTTGTSVFKSIARTGTNANATISGVGFSPDLVLGLTRSGSIYSSFVDRLRGINPTRVLITTNTAVEDSLSTATNLGVTSLTMDGVTVDADQTYGYINFSTRSFSTHFFKRAPGFFDEVCYTGTGVARTVAHSLGVAPELMIVKQRNTANDWPVYAAPSGNNKVLYLNFPDAQVTRNEWNLTTPTASVFSLNTSAAVNASGSTYVAYLFATCPGVSKVGSYTGTGATQVINCGFTGGARFVLIKSTSTSGDWYVWDSARGIVAGNDPYLTLNTGAAEVTTTDWVDTAATGFELSNAVGNLANTNGVTYIFLAIA